MDVLKKSLAALLVLAASVATAASGEPCDPRATTILVVRHADRAGKADSLSAAGVARAQDLSRAALAANVTAIYHSDTRRTRDTASPLAMTLGLQPVEYPAKECAALIERILREHAGQAVLVVGHSNTVPMIVAAAGGPMMGDILDNEFDGLFVVHVAPCQNPVTTLTHLQYGAASP